MVKGILRSHSEGDSEHTNSQQAQKSRMRKWRRTSHLEVLGLRGDTLVVCEHSTALIVHSSLHVQILVPMAFLFEATHFVVFIDLFGNSKV
jgi:hypothetical protein